MLSTVLLVVLSLMGVLGDVSHILEDHQRNLPSHGPYVFSYTAGYPGNVDRQHAEVRDGSGVVRDTYSQSQDPHHRVRTVGGGTGQTQAVAHATENHHRDYANIANDHARAHVNIANDHARASDTYSQSQDPHHRVRTVGGGTGQTQAVAHATENHHRDYANIANDHARAHVNIANDHARASGQSPPRQTAEVRAATNSHARLFNGIADQHAHIAADRGQGFQHGDGYYNVENTY